MKPDFDLDRYLERIGHSGNFDATLETLNTIHLCHTRAVAFENLNVLLGWLVPLDIASLQQKIVGAHRGGYCFEQNLLARRALLDMGFRVTGLAARVVYGLPDGVTLPRTHMLLRVEIEEQSYLVDVGFGGLTPTAPLRIEPHSEQFTPHEPFRVVPAGAGFIMQAKIAGDWKPLYHFSLEEQTLSDYEMMNWYTSTHPQSRFVQNLIAARPDHNRRFALFNSELSVHSLDGGSERRILSSISELREVLEGPFRLVLPDTPQLDSALARIIERDRQFRIASS